MARTTSALVAAIIEVDVSISLTPFIEVANMIVTSECTGGDHTVLVLAQIEKWLSAHVYTCRDPRAVREKAGSMTQEMQSKVDLGFDNSHYGQMAMRLDTEGSLSALNERSKKGKRATIGVTWLGTAKQTS